MDTKTSVIVISLVLCILYFAHMQAQAQASTIESLQQENSTLKLFVTSAREPVQSQSQSPGWNPAMDADQSERSPFPRNNEYGIGLGLAAKMDPNQPIPTELLDTQTSPPDNVPLPSYA